MQLPERFKEFCTRHFPLTSPVVLAVSGGIDSVVLCELSHQSGLNFSIAHCNFQLRGEESERDEKFVRSLGEKYDVKVNVKKFAAEDFATEKKLSIQEAARELRYAWFDELKRSGNAFVLLAHHANDNIETVLMNFFRGTGLEGMTGMKTVTPSGSCLRPMLMFSRKDIEEFARTNNLKWVEDSSNQLSKYTRNFFRNELIPSIQKAYPQAEQNILDNIDRFKRVNTLHKISVDKLIEKISTQDKTGLRIPVKALMKYKDTSLIYDIISPYGFGEKQVDEVVKLSTAGSGKFIENEMYQIVRHRNWFIITKRNEPGNELHLIEADMEHLAFAEGQLNIRLISDSKFQLQKSEAVAQLDAKHIEFPLVLRKWKQGDYFYPLGMRKKKKLARFFIDQKLSKNQKERVWVVESNKKILWVVGMRIDDRFKVTDRTKQLFKISWSSL